MDESLRAARDHNIGPAMTDPLGAVGDGLCAAGAGGHDGIDRAVGACHQADVIAGHVGQKARQGKRTDGFEAACAQVEELAIDHLEPAGPRADYGTHALCIGQGNVESGVLQRHHQRGNRQLRRARHASRFFEAHVVAWIEVSYLAGKMNGQHAGIDLGDGTNAGTTGKQACPALLRRVAKGTDNTDAGDDNARAVHRGHGFLFADHDPDIFMHLQTKTGRGSQYSRKRRCELRLDAL